MKKNQVNSILINQTRRRNTVFAFICVIIVVFVLALSFFMIYAQRNKAQYVSYDETSNINYKVLYNENEFFDENYLSADREYIASLINSINADFNYKISLEDKDVEYKYTYRIEANVTVKDKDSKNLFYDKTEVLLKEQEETTTLKEVNINENIVIDYNQYNDIIKRFVSVYDLENAESTLNINMYVSVIGSCEDFIENQEKERVITLSIPLTEDTMAIDFVDNIVNSSNNVMQCNSVHTNNFLLLFVGIILSIVDFGLIIAVIRYEIKTRTAETIYEKELKKILNNYGSSIQMLGSEFDFSDYQLLKIDDFSDILEISDKLRQPILMKENKEKTGAYFVIPSNTKLLYVYRLKVSDIEKEISEKNNKHLEEPVI